MSKRACTYAHTHTHTEWRFLTTFLSYFVSTWSSPKSFSVIPWFLAADRSHFSDFTVFHSFCTLLLFNKCTFTIILYSKYVLLVLLNYVLFCKALCALFGCQVRCYENEWINEQIFILMWKHKKNTLITLNKSNKIVKSKQNKTILPQHVWKSWSRLKQVEAEAY